MTRTKRQRNTKPLGGSLAGSSLSFSWVPLTLIILLYTSGLSIGESASEGVKSDDDSSVTDGETENVTIKRNYTLTGNPQLDYVNDPNLPRELNGYNLSTYPFFSRVPTPGNINFSCDGLKDGFYANIEHKCQVYHHCISTTRYDFLCGNYTAFDQKTFICQFASEVDCANSGLYFHRNSDLYWTTTPAPVTVRAPGRNRRLRPEVPNQPRQYQPNVRPDTSPATAVTNSNGNKDALEESDEDYAPEPPRRRKPANRRQRCKKGRRRGRGCRRPQARPAYYYDDDDYYEEDDYYDDYYDERPNKSRGKTRANKLAGSKKVETSTSTEPAKTTTPEVTQGTTASTTQAPAPYEDNLPLDAEALLETRDKIFTQSRPPPRIRPPVPRNERNKFDAMQGRSSPASTTTASLVTTGKPLNSNKTEEYDEYYEDDDTSQQQQPVISTSKPRPSTTTGIPVPKVLSSRQKLFNKNLRPTAATSTTTTQGTTPTTTTTLRPTSLRTSPPASPTTATITTTTTTTEPPQYEYEYEYEDDLPSTEKVVPQVPSTTTTTTTPTTTTTQKPSRNNYRGKQRPNVASSVQSSTSVTYQEPEDVLTSAIQDVEVETAADNKIDRRRQSWTRNQFAKGTSSTPNSIPSTSERFQVKNTSRGKQKMYDDEQASLPVITVKASPSQEPPLSRSTESVTKSRPSRFWQRPSKGYASSPTSTTTTTESSGDYADYSDEPELLPVPSPLPPSRFTSSRLSSGTSSSYQSPQLSANSDQRIPYPSSSPQYTRTSQQLNNGKDQQFLHATKNTYRQSQPSSRGSSITNSPGYLSPYGGSGSSSSSIGLTSSERPEFISLLRDDEDPYYDVPQQQTQLPSYPTNSNSNGGRRLPPRSQFFGNQPYHQSQKNLYGEAQETYSSFVPPPPRFSSGDFMSDFRPPFYPYERNDRHRSPLMLGI